MTENGRIDPELVRRVPYSFARDNGVIAVSEDDSTINVRACEGKVKALALAELRRVLGKPLKISMLAESHFGKELENAYSTANRNDDEYQSVFDDLEQDVNLSRLVQSIPQSADLLESGEDAPIIKLVNNIMGQALRERASDIHFESFENRAVVRFRIDGVLHDKVEPPLGLHTAIVSRLKVMAKLNIDVKRLPQDGRIAIRLANHPIDIRVSTLPSAHGERVVLRLLDKDAGLLTLENLGMGKPTMESLNEIIHQPHGIILVTGPTGSGKTTTLYAAITKVDINHLNVMTVEDPVEYNLEGISQTQVNMRIEMTFARALRSILRQDPDVVMIGEIRDLDTASIAVQASLTGHLVLATLHTNDSVSAVTRLIDMGVERYLLSSSLSAVLAQRLLRRLCDDCKEPRAATMTEQAMFNAEPITLYSPVGCSNCHDTGYTGRIGVFELLRIDKEMTRLIHDGRPEYELRDYATSKQKMDTLRKEGLRLAKEGITSIEEVVMATEAEML